MTNLENKLSEEDKILLEEINKKSTEEGWGIYLALGVGDDGTDEWRIERYDEMQMFNSDLYAIKFIINKALNIRSKLHMDTISFMVRNASKKELQVMLKTITLW